LRARDIFDVYSLRIFLESTMVVAPPADETTNGKPNVKGKPDPQDKSTKEEETETDEATTEEPANESTERQDEEAEVKDLEARAINEAAASADSTYVPSPALLSDTSPSPLLEQIDGPSLETYLSTPNIYTVGRVPLSAGSKLEVPIHISNGGSVVEYTVESERYDLTFGITAEREEKETVVKALGVADCHIKPCTGKFLVGTVPCVLLFTFDNAQSWITEKKISYNVIITPPSKENVMIGRRRRAASALKAVEDDRSSASERFKSAVTEKENLLADVDRLEKELAKQKDSLDAVKKEEILLSGRVELRLNQLKMLNDRLSNGWEDEKEKEDE